ncbi:MAG TPA: M20/M25/M40 family metallo-hydrolase [Terriglobales bacterium]|nr:M20/M25/M40 family metallo-hydrolase [Terriglobales bacterium]
MSTQSQHLRRLLAAVVTIALALIPAATVYAAAAANSTDDPDLDVLTRIRDEGFRRSKVMEIMSELTDNIGPRLTGSPNVKRANQWTRDQFAAWGLANAHLEPWGPFGRGWSQEYVNVRMTAPDVAPLIAYPLAWSPGTNGAVKGKAIAVKIEKIEDLEKYRGKLAGMVVLNGDMRDVKPHEKADLSRYDDKSLAEVAAYDPSPERRGGPQGPQTREEFARLRKLREAVRQFWADEKVLAVVEPSRGDGGTVFVQGVSNGWRNNGQALVPTLSMAIEHFGRISRLLKRDVPVELELDVRTKFYDDAATQYNTIAEIPGADPKLKDEVVMLGAHLDSWHTGTGATDNAAGSAVMMEAMRILKALDLKPRRTIRIALWTGEEEGLLGSRAYAKEHFGSRPDPSPEERDLPANLRRESGPLTLKPEQAKLAAYFNVDNGTGRIRGIYCQENAAVVPIFERWFEPFRDLSAGAISLRNTSGTDHLSFDAVGLPGFQFIQDEVEYSTRTHHSNMDVYERIQRADMMQNAVIVASFVYNAAMRDSMLPRKPLPASTPARGPEQKRAENPTQTILPATPASGSGAAAGAASGGENQK